MFTVKTFIAVVANAEVAVAAAAAAAAAVTMVTRVAGTRICNKLTIGARDPSGTGAAVAGLSIGRRVLLVGHRTRSAHAPVPTGLGGIKKKE